MLYKSLIRPLLFMLDPEKSHDLICLIGRLVPPVRFRSSTANPINMKNIRFRNPVGLAAGFDKNAQLIPLAYALGFGFTEIGSVTYLPSKGNPRPRLFRLPEEEALINRMGLNNDGAVKISERLKKIRRYPDFPIGVNIAKTNSAKIIGEAGIEDIVNSFKLLYPLSDYVTLNISCPNTEEGKTFEDPVLLGELLSEINKIKNGMTNGTCEANAKPVFLKLSPDLEPAQIDKILEVSAGIDGFVISNTKKDSRFGGGGISGRPIRNISTDMIRYVRNFSGLPIIACGGVNSVESAKEKINAGAELIQIYTGLIYEGPGLVKVM